MSTFVGRTAELAALADVTGRAADGPAAVFVVGDPGAGKSRLVREAAERVDWKTRLEIVGYEAERDVPLAAAATALRTLTKVPTLGPRLERLMFGADENRPLEPLRVFEAAHRALEPLEPVLLTVDDVQWVDDLSLALSHYLLRAADATGQRLAVFAAGRPSAQCDTYRASLASALDGGRFTTFALRPLEERDALELVFALAPRLDAAVGRALVRRAGGSPFWVEVLVRAENADVDVQQLVTTRLRGGSADAGELLALLAVAARPLAFADVAQLASWSVQRVEHAAAELDGRGIVVRTAAGIRLAHDLMRTAAAAEIPDDKRRQVHRRLAEWLESIAGNDIGRLREALGHRHAGGLPALDLALRLATARRRTLLGDEGLHLLARIADDEDPADGRVLTLNAAIAELAGELGNHAVALERASAVAERIADRVDAASGLLTAARAAYALDDVEAAVDYVGRARTLAAGDDVLELECDVQAAAIALWAGERRDPERARSAVERAHAGIEAAGGPAAAEPRLRRAYLEALRVEYEAAFQRDDVDGLLSISDERAAVAQGFDEKAYLDSLICAGRAFRRVGRLAEAEDRLRRAWEDAHRRVLPQLTIDAAYWLAMVLEHRGRIVEAEDVTTEAVELADRVGDAARDRHRISRLATRIGFHRGDWRHAVDALLVECEAASVHARIELYQELAQWLAFVGGAEFESEVLTRLTAARECAVRAACPRCGTELHLAAAEALARIGHADEAASSLGNWRRAQDRPQPRDLLLARRIEALVEANGNAAAELEAAAAEAERLGFRLDALWTKIDLGRAIRSSDRARAIEILDDAVRTADTYGAATERQVAEKALRGLGIRTWKRGSTAAPLTEREREIVRLIAAGASNPEIATNLFLSRKTVERHVSNVLKKVGVRNRVELAGRIGELEVEGAHR